MTEIAQATVASVSAQDVHTRRNAGESMVVLDVREPDEWAQGHIEGAMLLSRGRIEGRIEESIPDRDQCVVIH
jgi:rhodanese-related sulfurtransferase